MEKEGSLEKTPGGRMCFVSRETTHQKYCNTE